VKKFEVINLFAAAKGITLMLAAGCAARESLKDPEKGTKLFDTDARGASMKI
jgi:hypothetical protein